MFDPKQYTYRVTWSEGDGEYVALCAEFPSLSYLDKGQGKALKGIVNLVTEVIDDMDAEGEAVPEPVSGREYSGKFMVRIPPMQHKNLAIQAAEEGVSLNRLAASKLL